MNDTDKKLIEKKTNRDFKPKVVYTVEETELKKVEVAPNIYLRVINTSEDTYIDIRKYYKGYPTKKGIRFKQKVFNIIKDILNDIDDI